MDVDRAARRGYAPPLGMSFARSDAVFPPAELRAAIAASFEAQCRARWFGPYPTRQEVQARRKEIRSLL